MYKVSYIIDKYKKLFLIGLTLIFITSFFPPFVYIQPDIVKNSLTYNDLFYNISHYNFIKSIITEEMGYFPFGYVMGHLIFPILYFVLYTLILAMSIIFIIRKSNYLIYVLGYTIIIFLYVFYYIFFTFSPLAAYNNIPGPAFYIVLALAILSLLCHFIAKYHTTHTAPIKPPKPHKPTKAERIAELERQIQELQNRVNKDGQ